MTCPHDPPTACCRRCDQARPLEHRYPFMILCPSCGNKRCPKATHHDLPCGWSNEPGQPGSDYTGATVADVAGRFSGPDGVEWLREQRGGDDG